MSNSHTCAERQYRQQSASIQFQISLKKFYHIQYQLYKSYFIDEYLETKKFSVLATRRNNLVVNISAAYRVLESFILTLPKYLSSSSTYRWIISSVNNSLSFCSIAQQKYKLAYLWEDAEEQNCNKRNFLGFKSRNKNRYSAPQALKRHFFTSDFDQFIQTSSALP